MNRFFFSSRFLVAATLATAALGAATVAEARPEVFVSIGLQGGPGWVEPARGFVQPRPVYAQPRPVFVEPAPVFMRPPVFISDREAFEGPRFDRHDARFEWERERAWRHAEWRRHERHEDFRGGGHDRDDDHWHGREHRD
jgi:hypothetical protein